MGFGPFYELFEEGVVGVRALEVGPIYFDVTVLGTSDVSKVQTAVLSKG